MRTYCDKWSFFIWVLTVTYKLTDAIACVHHDVSRKSRVQTMWLLFLNAVLYQVMDVPKEFSKKPKHYEHEITQSFGCKYAQRTEQGDNSYKSREKTM